MYSLFLLSVFINIADGCHTFNNTKIMFRSKSGLYFNTTITGCIERGSFGNLTATEIEVKGEKIPYLRKDDVRHLVKLKSISFEDCQIWEIEPALFRNVGSLRLVKIAFNDFVEVKKGIFSTIPSLEVLKLNNNNIDRIEDGAFGNLTKLREVHCDHNRLEDWQEQWFSSSTNVAVMNFRFNKIKVMRSFANFKKLKEIYFDNNELEVIQPEAFKGIRKLNYLGLRYNKLTTIDQRIFPWDFTIDVFSIGANHLNYMPRGVLAKITVKEMEVQGNPWMCSCLDQIYNWLYETNATVKKQDYCGARNIPVCCASSPSRSCLERQDLEATDYFLRNLREYEPPLDRYCARLFY